MAQKREGSSIVDKLIWPLIVGVILIILGAFISPRIPVLNPVILTPTPDEGSFEIATLVESEITPATNTPVPPTPFPTLAPPPTVEKPTQVAVSTCQTGSIRIWPGYYYTDDKYGSNHWMEFTRTGILRFGNSLYGYPDGDEGAPWNVSISTLPYGVWTKVHEFANVPDGAFWVCPEYVSATDIRFYGKLDSKWWR